MIVLSVAPPANSRPPLSPEPLREREKGQSCPSPFRPRRNRCEWFPETTGFGRLRIPHFGFLAKPLHDPARGIDSDLAEVLETLKTDPTATPSLDLPSLGKPSIPCVGERRGQASGAFTRSLGPDRRPGDVLAGSKDAFLDSTYLRSHPGREAIPDGQKLPYRTVPFYVLALPCSHLSFSPETLSFTPGEVVSSRDSFRTYPSGVRSPDLLARSASSGAQAVRFRMTAQAVRRPTPVRILGLPARWTRPHPDSESPTPATGSIHGKQERLHAPCQREEVSAAETFAPYPPPKKKFGFNLFEGGSDSGNFLELPWNGLTSPGFSSSDGALFASPPRI